MTFDITTQYETGATLVAKVMNGNTQVGSDISLTESTTQAGYYYNQNIDTSTYGTGTYAILIVDFVSGDVLGGDSEEFISNQTRADYLKAQGDAIEADTNELQTNQGNFATATGFATPANVTAAQTAIVAEVNANETKIDTLTTNVGSIPTNPLLTTDARLNNLDATISSRSTFDSATDDVNTNAASRTASQADVSALATQASVDGLNDLSSADITAAVPSTAQIEAALLNEGDGQQLIDAIVQAIGNENISQSVLVAAIRSDLERVGGMLDTVPVLSEIEASTVLAKTSDITGLNDIEATDVWAVATKTITGGQVDTIAGTIQTLDDLDTTQDTQHAATQSAISGLPTPLTAAQVNAEVDTALSDYDAPTKAELDTAESNIIAALPSTTGLATATDVTNARDAVITEIDANETKIDTLTTNVAAIETKAQADTRQTALVAEHDATQASISALNDVSAADVNAQVDLAISDAGLDTMQADLEGDHAATQALINALNDLSSADVTAAVPTTSEIEAALLNEGDGQQIIDAIVQAIGNENLDQVALVAAIRADIERSDGLMKETRDQAALAVALSA